MRIALSFFLILSLDVGAACDFSLQANKVFSLSGPVTVALKHLGLLKSSKLKGISVFNPIRPEDFSGSILPGGIFLSPAALKDFQGGTVFYDESQELSRTFQTVQGLRALALKTRSLTPGQVQESVLRTLSPFLTGCEANIRLFQKTFSELEKDLLTQVDSKQTYVFYLGEIKGARYPDLLIANDGVVKWLKDLKKLKTYPSELAYVGWSRKILDSLPATAKHVGIIDSTRSPKEELQKVGEGHFNLTFPGALVPGISQLQAWSYVFRGLRASH